MPIYFDLNARIIPPDREVFVTRPGKGYKLYLDFVQNDVVGPDLPHLELIPGKTLADHKDLDRRVRRARAIRNWHRGKRIEKRPSTSLSDYSDSKTDKSIASLRAVISGFFEKAKEGDLVIVPPSAYSQDAYIGEITSSSTDYVKVKSQIYDDDTITGRRVKWLERIQKRQLPTPILNALEHPTSIYLLGRTDRPAIYETAFKTFIDMSRNEPDFIARFLVSSETYTTSADFLLQAFFNRVASNKKQLDAGQELIPTFYAAAFDHLGPYALDLRTNVNSPGFLSLGSKFATPLIAAVLFAIALEVPNAQEALKDGIITIGNSKAPPNDPCTAGIIAGTLSQMQMLGLTEEWAKACEIAKRAAENGGITSTITVEKKP
jgi:hypothetical protein